MLEHSPLGASSAERWMQCAGSTTLIELLRSMGGEHDDDPEYRRDGIQAHALAADCLGKGEDAWEGDPLTYPELTEDMMAAVQVHLDYVRSRQGWQFVELRMHRPEFHELMYGTTDVAVLDPERLEIIDYKHGVGIVVEVEDNPQIMYYAFMVIDELGSAWADDCPITLTICQPRVTWREPVRSWQTTVGTIRQWAINELRPAMERAYTDGYLSTGEHCRFCPAKLICPAFLSGVTSVLKTDLANLQALSEPLLANLLDNLPLLSMAAKAIRGEARRRMIDNRGEVPNYKVVRAIAHRAFKQGAPIEATFGEEAWQPRELKSPAMIEKEPGGKKFVAEWAFSPDVGYDIVHVSDRRAAVKIETSADKWKNLVDLLKPTD